MNNTLWSAKANASILCLLMHRELWFIKIQIRLLLTEFSVVELESQNDFVVWFESQSVNIDENCNWHVHVIKRSSYWNPSSDHWSSINTTLLIYIIFSMQLLHHLLDVQLSLIYLKRNVLFDGNHRKMTVVPMLNIT